MFLLQILWTLSNDDSIGNEKVISNYKFMLLILLPNDPNLFIYVVELSRN